MNTKQVQKTMSNEQIEIAKRLHRGNQIFQAGLVKWIKGDYYEVTSQSNPNLVYGVDSVNKLCDCEDFQRHYPNPCKHWYSVNCFRMNRIREMLTVAQVKAVANITDTSSPLSGKRFKIGIVQ